MGFREELKKQKQEDIEKAIQSLSNEDLYILNYDWKFWARDNQLPPKGFGKTTNLWVTLAGRGWGKTRTGSEFIRQLVYDGYKRIALIGPTPADARDVMVEGESGLLSVFPPEQRPVYEPSKRQVTFHTGAIGKIYSGFKPDQLRGPQHDAFWADELASWQYLQETWDMLMFGWRMGKNPVGIVTTTPRPLKIIKELKESKNVVLSTGSSFENKDNLSPQFFDAIVDKYEGTRLGRQELYAQILDDNPNALWTRQMIEDAYVSEIPDLKRIVVAIDPNASDNESSDEVGIVVGAIDYKGIGYILEDASTKGTPQHWGRTAVQQLHKHNADRIVAEINQGGNMVEYVIKSVSKHVPYKGVHASKGKRVRAEPIAALYEQNKIKHFGNFPQLEDELCEWEYGQKSPNRLDALVWCVTELFFGSKGANVIKKARLGL